MKLLEIADSFRSGAHFVVSGRLTLEGMARSSEVKALFGSSVFVHTPDGLEIRGDVKEVSVSQSLAGALQVTLAIVCPSSIQDIPRGSSVMSSGGG
jgi:hypothetical protein